MNKNIISYIAIAVITFVPVVVLASPTPSPVSTPPASSGSSSTATPPTSGSSSTATPPTSESSSTAIPVSNPVVPPTSGSGSTAVPVTPPSNNGGSSSSSGSSSSGGSSSYSSGGSRRGAFGYCSILTGNMRYGANNNVNDVVALQNFLKNVEKLNVDVNGIFDLKTHNAVIAFQNKYSDVVLAPWGIRSGTGYVYITTIKKINQIACNQPLTLNANELAIINSSKNRTQGVAIISVKPNTTTTEITIDSSASGTDVLVEELESTEENTASVAKASILSRFWNFLVYLFR